jgi:hypothetical protein
MRIPSQMLASFLRAANKSTYANKDASKTTSTRLWSEDYHFEQDDLIFHDTYFGDRDFIGEEIVYKDGKPVWGMNYYGYVLKPSTSEKEVYGFLKKALLQEYSDAIPVRGASVYSECGWKYTNKQEGDLSRFNGTEDIYKDDKLVYCAHYHGGAIE